MSIGKLHFTFTTQQVTAVSFGCKKPRIIRYFYSESETFVPLLVGERLPMLRTHRTLSSSDSAASLVPHRQH